MNFSQGICLCVLPPASAVEPAGRCSGEEEETFQFRAAAALHPLAPAQPPADPGAGVSVCGSHHAAGGGGNTSAFGLLILGCCHAPLLPVVAVVCCHLPLLLACQGPALYQCLTVTLSTPGSTLGSAWQPPQPTLCEELGRQHPLLRWECGESLAPAQPDCSQAPCLWHEAPSPRVSPLALASGADPTLPRRPEPADGSSLLQAASALPSPGYGSRSSCNRL